MSACVNVCMWLHAWVGWGDAPVHPASRLWQLGWPRWVPALAPAPAVLDLPGSLPRLTPWGPALCKGWQQGQDPPGLQVQEAPAGRSSPSPHPSPGQPCSHAVKGAQPGTLGTVGAPDPCVAQLCPPGPWGSRGSSRWGTARQPTHPTPSYQPNARRKSRRYWVAGCSHCLGHSLWPEISWCGHHSSITLGFAFSTKGGPSQQEALLPPDPQG